MRRSRKKRPDKPLIPRYNVNRHIAADEVRVINAEGENIGVMPTKEAIALAREQEKDLVEINPKANPPVTQITEFTRFKFQKEKEARKQKARTHVSEMKGIRLSIRIGPGDFETRIKQAEKFLNRGDKIKAEIILRGRDRAKVPDAYKVIEEFIQTINASIPTRTEQEPDRQGNKVTAIFAKK